MGIFFVAGIAMAKSVGFIARPYAVWLGLISGVVISFVGAVEIVLTPRIFKGSDDAATIVCMVIQVVAPFLAGVLATRRHVLSGHCVSCSYDLRAHKPGGKCPECGTPISGS